MSGSVENVFIETVAVNTRPCLLWPLKSVMPTVEDERSIVEALIKSPQENGRGIDLPEARKEEITAYADRLGFLLSAAMSLRRQLIRHAANSDQRFWSKPLQMGDPNEANNYSAMFEDLVAAFLKSSGVTTFLTERDLFQQGYRNTPDFFIPQGCFINGKLIYWIDCKTFYGAAMLAHNTNQPVGKLLSTAQRYNSHFGYGCFVFLNGFSCDLEALAGLGGSVLLLDATPLDTTELFAYSAASVAATSGSRAELTRSSAPICRFFPNPGCRNGDACAFYHDHTIPSNTLKDPTPRNHYRRYKR